MLRPSLTCQSHKLVESRKHRKSLVCCTSIAGNSESLPQKKSWWKSSVSIIFGSKESTWKFGSGVETVKTTEFWCRSLVTLLFIPHWAFASSIRVWLPKQSEPKAMVKELRCRIRRSIHCSLGSLLEICVSSCWDKALTPNSILKLLGQVYCLAIKSLVSSCHKASQNWTEQQSAGILIHSIVYIIFLVLEIWCDNSRSDENCSVCLHGQWFIDIFCTYLKL